MLDPMVPRVLRQRPPRAPPPAGAQPAAPWSQAGQPVFCGAGNTGWR